ncbi:fatty acid--CoA ligase [Blastomonas marina]|uniref:fatty acid--CoA ligase n=1 Tax=Blastomonas marina TaxID=1867408 RepID=UPI002AC9E896|nr:fatty acid--CoA ligase [Blastomonas marina]WPZ05236.1 fatty acid--CoA ligase [Blastomonas marina]
MNDWRMPDPASFRTLADLAIFNQRDFLDRIAFHCDGTDLTFDQFARHTAQVANGLRDIGIGADERVAFLGRNTIEFYETVIGAARAGAVVTPINWRLAPPEIEWILRDCAARVLFVDAAYVEVAAELRGSLPGLEFIICMQDCGEAFVCYDDWREEQSDSEPGVTRAPDDAALQLYTSGTTGFPKGVVLSSKALLRADFDYSPEKMDLWDIWDEDDVLLLAMPNFHIGGIASGIRGLKGAIKSAMIREFEPGAALDAIERHRVTKTFLVPAAIHVMLAHPKAQETDFSSLRLVGYGASPIPLDLLRAALKVFGCDFAQVYGLTETTGTICALMPEDHSVEGNERMRGIGQPINGVEMKVIDADGNEVETRGIGEIAIRSTANLTEYWNRPDATAEAVDAEGWFRTGDAGYVDEDGYYYLFDRIKDMIVTGGENVYPAEVENAVFGCEGVADVAVFGVPDEKWGEAVKACVVRKPGSDVSEADIIAHARERIAGFKCPKSVDFLDALPRNPSGKVLRRELRAPYWEGQDRQIS